MSTIVIIGGGATGTGIARAVTEQGFRAVLIERGTYGSGTSGRFHGMLHSGARYAVNDPSVAAECYQENQRLRQFMPTAISDTGGLFVALNEREANHTDVVLQACQQAGIPTQELTLSEAFSREPQLNPAAKRVFAVPDGFIDGAELLKVNVAAASATGLFTAMTNHEVTELAHTGDRLTHVSVRNGATGDIEDIACDYVVNAAGVWATAVAELVNVDIPLLFDKGTMIVFNEQLSNAVLNRCRPEDDGDLLVPHAGQSIMGTTARVTSSPDNSLPTQEEADVLVREGLLLVPALGQTAALRIYSGVRPLYGEGALKVGDSRAMSRSFSVLDHADQGLQNFISVVGGKVTLHRRMAEAAVAMIQTKIG